MALSDHIIHLKDGKMAGATTAQSVKTMVSSALAQPGGLLLHFHGGLVNDAAGRDIAKRLLPVYQAAGVYPIFFVWEAGLFEILKNNLSEIARERLFKLLFKLLLRIVKRKLGQSVADRNAQALPQVDDSDLRLAVSQLEQDPLGLDQLQPDYRDTLELTRFEQLSLEQELTQDLQLVNSLNEISNGLLTPQELAAAKGERSARSRASSETLMDPDQLDTYIERPDPAARGFLSTAKFIKSIVVLAAQIIKRYRSDRDHGFHATLVEELLRKYYVGNAGQLIWDLMKKDTADSFQPDTQVYGGSCLIAELARQMNAGQPSKIRLVGHSTGAVYISEFLESADAMLPAGQTFDVMFLAPAITAKKFSVTLAQHRHRIANLRMFTMRDDLERKDTLVPIIYPHSLLYFISGVLEDNSDTLILGMQRYYDPNVYDDADFLFMTSVREYMLTRVAWSIADDGNGRTTASRKHGDFDNDAATLASIGHIIQRGF